MRLFRCIMRYVPNALPTKPLSIWLRPFSGVIAYLFSGLAGQFAIPEQAARLLGFASRLLTTKLVYRVVEQAHYERILTRVCAQLDEITYASAYAEGYAMTPDQAVAFALAQFSGSKANE